MALTTYDELKTSVADFLNRDDLTSVIPDFITLAETAMNRSIRHWRMEKRANAIADTQYTALPTDYLQMIRLSIIDSTTSTIENVGQFEISKLRMQNNNTLGKPVNFTILDGSIELNPTPDTSYDVQLLYYGTNPPLNAQTSSNWLLQYYPDAYLYGSLLHSAPYLQDDARTTIWASLYKSAIDAINLDSEYAKTSGSGGRIKIRSY